MNQDRCYIITGNSDNTLQCDIGNPLNINDIVKFQVKLDTSKLTGKSKEIKIDINVISQSKEQHLLDNSVSVIVSFIAKTHISITGFTEREQILYGPGQPGVLPLEQGYMVSKISPSPISVVTLIISVPSSVGRNTQQLVNVNQVEVGDGSNTYVSGSCNIRTVDELDKTGTDVDDTDWEHILSCKTAVCREIRCDVGPFSNIRKVAKVRIVGEVDTEALKKTLGRKDVITIKSEAKVWIPDPAGYDPNVPPDYTSSAKTQLVLAGAPPPIQVAAWIYIVSIIVGIFLLLLLGYGMYRLGFFKRKQREDLEKMKEQIDTDELKPCLESKTNYDKDSFS
ncbi:integrin alpha-5-like [Tachypleus tridentatus]|uniref:integrin alpha-5-like n=1 Tax=Tachypleus tridentatus TaxID=6853 RepID=UPI003FCFCE0F